MDNHFTITITDDKGVKQFNVHKFIKKALFYGALFLVVFALLSLGTIFYLYSTLNDLNTTQKELKTKNKELIKNINLTQKSLDKKREELGEISNKLSEIEVIMGLSPDEEQSLQERIDLADISSQEMTTLFQFVPSGSPMQYSRVSAKFGSRMHPVLKRKEFHRGIDLKNIQGTPVYATADATVEFAGYHKASGYGNLIILKHNYGFKTYFGHLNKVVIKSEQFIKKGQLIGYCGNTGMSTGPHLHYEVRYKNNALNPKWFMEWNVSNYKEIFTKDMKVPWQSLIKATQHIKIPNPIAVVTPQLSQPAQKLKVR